MSVSSYGKTISAAVYAVAVVAIPLYTGDNNIDPAERVIIATAIATALLTYLVPLVPQHTWVKTTVGAALAGLGVLSTVISEGVDANEALLVVASVLGALGIAVAPAASTTGVAVGWGADTRKA